MGQESNFISSIAYTAICIYTSVLWIVTLLLPPMFPLPAIEI